ncbi:AAA family ATPase [Microbulbifer sp. SH-1]|uniref:ATP-binding protein n=1 Tax=Microbulbifer sp. SH-1 TaxID=2681547 RepID=UPI00140C9ADA|nr:ATP-binding protein [Microbulbifer sp. SH-1]QIL90454.1 AAA family ATPase [Microbulbifer sp. SH-1]
MSNGFFPQGQIRLAELSVYNWGSFHGLHTASIDAHGTLITGDNGAGKSTLIDGLMALLLPAGKSHFNVAAAQGDRSDRSLFSYMRGSFGSEHDGAETRTRNKREGATATALRALYRADDGSEITLAALFWTTKPGNSLSDLSRLYLVAKRNYTLEEMLRSFGEGDARALKQTLKQDPTLIPCDDHFGEYRENYRRLLHMENGNAPALLSRALGLKKIDDLTQLIRDLVLEPSGVRDDARKAVAEFDDLNSVHEQLCDVRAQCQALASLPQTWESYLQATSALDARSADLAALPVWFGEQCAALWQQRIESLLKQLDALHQQRLVLEQREQQAQQDVESRHADYLQAGGERIELLKKDLEQARSQLQQVTSAAGDYQKLARALQLPDTLDAVEFHSNQQRAQAALENAAGERQQAQDAFAEASARLGNLQSERNELQEQIREIEARPDSNIDPAYQKLRDQMSEELAIPAGELMFIGELIDVQEEHRGWQGAIERALGGLRTTLAVPRERFSMVTRWLNARHTGLHVRAQVVSSDHGGPADFKADGYLRKLVWREHRYRDWLKRHLARFDLQCVANTAALDATPFSITQQGLIHLERGRFEKKDQHRIDNRRTWALGFSNKSRLALIQRDLQELESTLAQQVPAVAAARAAMDAIEQRNRQWEKLADFRWLQIDVPEWQQRVEKLQSLLLELENDRGDLARAKQRWDQAKALHQEIGEQLAQHNKRIWETDKSRQEAESRLDSARQEAAIGMDDALRERLDRRIGALSADDLETAAALEQRHRGELEQERNRAAASKTSSSNGAISIVSTFYSKWETVASDWGRNLDAVPEYLTHLASLEDEGLPALVEQFRERLNRHTTQSLAGIRSKIESEREDIRERIEVINRVLARTEFKAGSYLRLCARTDQYPHVRDFNQQLTRLFSLSASDDHESRFALLKQVIQILDKASNPVSAGTLESLRLLDPRHQMSFYAEEVGRADQIIRDVLDSSSGKSGGEKEAFAGVIVAASLAYVLTPDGSDKPIYSTVFLDEAFSNTAEAVSRRVLRVFRELHIHVNLITPYKNLNLARESARALLIAERNADTHESQLCEVTWEEIDQRMQTAAQRSLAAEAEVQVEPA